MIPDVVLDIPHPEKIVLLPPEMNQNKVLAVALIA
jgi:hypothetical protein